MIDKTSKQLHDEIVRLRFEYIRLTEEQRNNPEGNKIFSIAREYSEAIRKIQERNADKRRQRFRNEKF